MYGTLKLNVLHKNSRSVYGWIVIGWKLNNSFACGTCCCCGRYGLDPGIWELKVVWGFIPIFWFIPILWFICMFGMFRFIWYTGCCWFKGYCTPGTPVVFGKYIDCDSDVSILWFMNLVKSIIKGYFVFGSLCEYYKLQSFQSLNFFKYNKKTPLVKSINRLYFICKI